LKLRPAGPTVPPERPWHPVDLERDLHAGQSVGATVLPFSTCRSLPRRNGGGHEDCRPCRGSLLDGHS
jgi:hypothetical protein